VPRKSPVKRSRTARPKRAAQRIRETARDLFYRQGIRAVGVDEIVTRAGVTKPSLYRSFPSKAELAAAYLRDHGEAGLRRFNAAMDKRPDDPRGQLHAWLAALAVKASKADYRGCGTTNAAVEYADRRHPARKQAAAIKRQFRERLTQLAAAMGAKDPSALADALLLLMEGTYTSGQMFGPGGPPRVLVQAAEALIDIYVPRKPS
jgi:AcrR family transcriptional regulator